MKPWLALVKKDLRMNRTFMLVFWLLLLAFSLWFTYAFSTTESILLGTAILFILHIAYFPLYLFLCLSGETKQLHLWLHTPRSVIALLSSKITSGIIATFLSMGLAAIYPLWLSSRLYDQYMDYIPFTTGELIRIGIELILLMVLLSIQLGIVILFFWSLHRWIHRFAGKWTWVITFFAVISLMSLWSQFTFSPVYDALTQWGEPIPLYVWQFAEYAEIGQTYLGQQLFEVISTLLFFAASVWILERRLEV